MIDGIVSVILSHLAADGRMTVVLETGSELLRFLTSDTLEAPRDLKSDHHVAVWVKDDPLGPSVIVQFTDLGPADSTC